MKTVLFVKEFNRGADLRATGGQAMIQGIKHRSRSRSRSRGKKYPDLIYSKIYIPEYI